MLLRNQHLNSGRSKAVFDVHLTPLSRDGGNPSLLLMFAPQSPGMDASNSTGRRATPQKSEKSKSTGTAGKKGATKVGKRAR
jgi:hypothetical protein